MLHDWKLIPTFSEAKVKSERKLYKCVVCGSHWLSLTEPLEEGCKGEKTDMTKIVVIPVKKQEPLACGCYEKDYSSQCPEHGEGFSGH